MKNDYLDRHDLIQRLEHSCGIYKERSTEYMGFFTCFVICALIASGAAIKSCMAGDPLRPASTKNCAECHNKVAQKHAKLTAYFRKHGSKTPEVMANAVLETRSPRLMAAIAKTESNGNPHLSRTGYKRRHYGAFQVSKKDWGTVPKDPILQARQAEAILEELLGQRKNNIVAALNTYGGDSRGYYAQAVLRNLKEVPR